MAADYHQRDLTKLSVQLRSPSINNNEIISLATIYWVGKLMLVITMILVVCCNLIPKTLYTIQYKEIISLLKINTVEAFDSWEEINLYLKILLVTFDTSLSGIKIIHSVSLLYSELRFVRTLYRTCLTANVDWPFSTTE